MESRNRDVLVVLESSQEQAERTEAINEGLMAEGGRIAGLLEGSLHALVTDIPMHNRHTWVQTAGTLLEDRPFRLILFAHTDAGGEMAPRIAHALGVAAVTDCFDIRYRNETLHYAKYVHGGRYEQEVTFSEPPEIVSLNLEFLRRRDTRGTAHVPARKIQLRIPESAEAIRTIRTLPPDFRTVGIEYAQRILDIGAGCGSPELLEQAEELAGLLEASIGTTRLVVDGGRISKSRMIGQTGKEVSPERCLTLGVSGSPHHTAGIGKAGMVLSVNSDERAPVFGASDAGFVSDLRSLLPRLIRRIKQYRDENLK
jgi:electron transfer flavoprotein alpha subunit